MAIDYSMPKLAMAMNEGTINEWLAGEGDYVEEGQLLATIETEKVSYDVESPHSGYLHIIVAVGETVDCEVRVAQFAESEEELAGLQAGDTAAVEPAAVEPAAVEPAAVEPAAVEPAAVEPAAVEPAAVEPAAVGPAAVEPAAVEPAATPTAVAREESAGGRIKASPLARKMATDAGLDLARLSGTGPGGRIVKRDILAVQDSAAALPAVTTGGDRVLARLPLQGMRKTIASRMTQSLRETAQLSSHWESDITDLISVRESFVARAEQLGTRVSFNAFLIKALVYALRQVPIANSCLEGDEIVVYDRVNMGIAISVPGSTEFDSGLMVAVLHGVERMGVVEIDREMKALIERVRSGAARAEDLSGSTFTLSSTAGIAPPGLHSTPVLNLPNAALLGPSTPVQRPVVHNGEVVVRTMLPLSFTFDHRILDGEPAARCMNALHECLEHPELMLA